MQAQDSSSACVLAELGDAWPWFLSSDGGKGNVHHAVAANVSLIIVSKYPQILRGCYLKVHSSPVLKLANKKVWNESKWYEQASSCRSFSLGIKQLILLWVIPGYHKFLHGQQLLDSRNCRDDVFRRGWPAGEDVERLKIGWQINQPISETRVFVDVFVGFPWDPMPKRRSRTFSLQQGLTKSGCFRKVWL